MPRHFDCLEGQHFGFCPECREPNEHQGCLNIERTHWYVCHKHKVTWYVGSNLFSCWKDETPETWDRNAAVVNAYQPVEPMYCQCAGCVARREEVRAEREVGLQTADVGEIPF